MKHSCQCLPLRKRASTNFGLSARVIVPTGLENLGNNLDCMRSHDISQIKEFVPLAHLAQQCHCRLFKVPKVLNKNDAQDCMNVVGKKTGQTLVSVCSAGTYCLS